MRESPAALAARGALSASRRSRSAYWRSSPSIECTRYSSALACAEAPLSAPPVVEGYLDDRD